MKPLTLVFALAGLACGPAAAQQIPRFNIEAICSTAPALTPEDRDPVQGCIRDETAAERQLNEVWSASAAANRETCAAETQVGGSPSYVDILTCLQMYQGSAPTAPPRRRRQQ